ncbi:MAG: purine-nucleoside phosphorylase [Pyrinomonadaceae bacterium]|nr:purine-nucleoside phosphorylase [Pyrinomonadaceae bacterium]
MSYDQASEAADFVKNQFVGDIRAAIVLGSGLGAFAEKVVAGVTIPFAEIPGFVRSTVEGHAGQLVIGDLNGVTVAIQQGRFHYYEGYDMEQVMLPVRTFGLLGIKDLILTNAAGSLNSDMPPGSLMMITDHINCFGVNPLRGLNDARFGPRFPDMTEVYDRALQAVAEQEAAAISRERSGLDLLNKGIYCGLSGPTYETPAEVSMYRQLGADAVGMSTVPEAIAARHMGMRVLGISCITNFAAGMTNEAIDHSHVMTTGAEAAEVFGELLKRVVARMN